HAVLSAREYIKEPFLVVNADDYYGPEAYKAMYESVIALPEGEASMAGYSLGVTLSPTGGVTRGICAIDGEGYLESVTETYGIHVDGDKIITREGGELEENVPVSMNVWGMRADIVPYMQQYFELYLKNLTAENELTKECLLPEFVDWMLKGGNLKVKAVQSGAAWLGLTCRADVPPVEAALLKLSRDGNYPPLC
ncbi:MAG: nucleotidyltransferase, partial [Oscillospiraceae bacterium]|nr:nucleotidyltransferase [Oscillospiraceae bacterium]